MTGAKGSKNKVLLGITIVLLFVLLASSALLFISIWEKKQGTFPEQAVSSLNSTIVHNGEEFVLNKDLETVLVLGLDKYEADKSETGSYNNDSQADFLMLLVIDNKNSNFTALQINRDTMAEMNVLGVAGDKVGSVTKQIALAHTYGNGKEVSCRNTADAVSKLMSNIKINHYLSLTMDSLPVFNELVGGVEVELLEDFTDKDPAMIKGETLTLTGTQALSYVRTRYGLEDSTNATRMQRQRQYLNALYTKVIDTAETDENFIIRASSRMSDYLVSNCTVTKLQTLFEKVSQYKFNGIVDFEGESVQGERFMEFYPDENSVKETVIELFYKKKD